MTDEQLALQAVSDAQRILEEYLEPRPRNNERVILDKLVSALIFLSPLLGCRVSAREPRNPWLSSCFVGKRHPLLSELQPRIFVDRAASAPAVRFLQS